MALLFLLFTALVVAAIAAAIIRYLDESRRSIGLLVLGVWLLYTASLGYSGLLADPTGVPPRIILVLVPVVLSVMFLARSGTGGELALSFPLGLLIGAQTFRIVVEVFIHQMWSAGLLPRMLTYDGANFDILAGLSAPVVAWLTTIGRLSHRVALGWNVFGLLLLANIVVRAILTAPATQLFVAEVPNRAFGLFPYTFIPGVMAPLAVMLHVLAIRALLSEPRTAQAAQLS